MTSRRARRFCLHLALAGASVIAAATPSPARADATAEQRAAAQALFDDARHLMADKRFADACPKLEESQRLDPGLGTLLNLAECQAQVGKTASAWANFLEAAFQARAAGQTKRENTARTRAAALEPRLSRLTILAVPGAKVEIKRDGAVVASSLFGTSVPVDPGEHVVSASGPGKKPWESNVTVRPEGHQVSVSVPQLEDAPAEPPPEVKPPPPPQEVKPPPAVVRPPPPPPPEDKPPPPETSAGKAPRTAGTVLTVIGFAGLGTAAAFTVLTKIRLDDSNGAGGCVGNVCPPSAYDARTDARNYGNIATGAWIGGGVVTATGLALLVASGVIRDNALKAQVVPVAAIDPGHGATLGLNWRF